MEKEKKLFNYSDEALKAGHKAWNELNDAFDEISVNLEYKEMDTVEFRVFYNILLEQLYAVEEDIT